MFNLLRTASIFILFVSLPAELIISGGEYHVNTELSGSQSNPRVAAFDSCGYVSVWRSRTPFWRYEIRSQIFGCNGEKVGTELGPIPNSFQGLHPSIATNGDEFIVVWESHNVPQGDDILAQLYNKEGTLIGNTITVAHIASNEAKASVSSLSSGGYVITWNGIKGQKLDSAGSHVGTPFTISNVIHGDHINSEVTRLSSGFVSIWLSQDGYETGISGQHFNDDISKIGTEFFINTQTVGVQSKAAVASLSSGGFVVVWLSFHNFEYEIVGQVFNSNGEKVFGDQFRVVQPTSNHITRPEVTSTPSGGFVVVWEEYIPGHNFEIFGQEFLFDGTLVGNHFQVNTITSGHQTRTAITSTGSALYVNWVGKDGSSEGIFGQNYNFPIVSDVLINNSPLKGVELLGLTEKKVNSMELIGIPEVFTSGVLYVPETLPLGDGTIISLSCNDNTPCHFFLSVYSCAPCNSWTVSGGFPLLSVNPDYDAASCAPKFISNNKPHSMVTFHIKVSPGDSTSVPATTQELRYFSIIKTDSNIPSPWCFKAKGPHFTGQAACDVGGCPDGTN